MVIQEFYHNGLNEAPRNPPTAKKRFHSVHITVFISIGSLEQGWHVAHEAEEVLSITITFNPTNSQPNFG